MIRNNNYYWPTILEDCFKYYKGCQECQKFGSIQRVSASAMNPIIKPWPFRGWAIDLIGQIYPPSSKGHKFVLVATNYFTRWVEAIPIKTVTSGNMIDFFNEHKSIGLVYLRLSQLTKGVNSLQGSLKNMQILWESNC
jgi:hypothetical protein